MINITSYNFNGANIREFQDNLTVSDFIYEDGTTSQSSLGYISANAVNVIVYRKVDTDQLYLIFIFNKYDPTQTADIAGSIDFTVSGLSSPVIALVDDTTSDSATLVDPSTVNGVFSWQEKFMDALAIEVDEPLDGVGITVNSYSHQLDSWAFIDNDETSTVQTLSGNTSISQTQTIESIEGDGMIMDPPPSIYDESKTITPYIDSDYTTVILTNDGTAPTLAEYIAYDNLDPPNPFIATVQDGRGNVTFDGGFPKLYNDKAPVSGSAFGDISAEMKYFHNVMHFISNQDKVSNGNNKILFLGDADAGDNYNIKETGSSHFNITINRICDIAGFEPVIRTRSDFGGTLDPSYSFLEQHCAVILFSTRSITDSPPLITSQAVSNIVTFRENGNGMFIVTDHGTGSNGFYVTGNAVASQFGAYFEGDFDRTPVNVGFLRSTYGDHPLYDNMDNSEDIFAGGSESRVFITEYTEYTPTTVPLQYLDTQGYTNYKFLLQDSSGNVETYSFTYGLQVDELINFLDESNSVISEIDVGVDNRATLNFELMPGTLGTLSGLIKRNEEVIGETTHNGSNQFTSYYKHDGNEILVNDNDRITVQITSPLEYIKNIDVTRFQPDIQSIRGYSRFMRIIENPQWTSQTVNRNEKTVLDYISQENTKTISKNVNIVRAYMNNTLELPEAVALVYSSTTDADEARQTDGTPSQQEIFDTWGVFASSTSGDSFYTSKSEAPNTDPFSTWVYDTQTESIVQTANTNFYTGFVSTEQLETYELEVTLTSPGTDDDALTVVIAHHWDSTNSINQNLSLMVNNGGLLGDGNLMAVIKNYQSPTGTSTIASASHDTTFTNANGGNGWSGRSMRVRVRRDGDIINIVATPWDVLDTYDPNSEIVIDLSQNPETQIFTGPQSYGYGSRSQANSTYRNIAFTGGVNYDFVVDMEQQMVYRYDPVSLEWQSTGLTVQDLYGYPRQVRNSVTGETFYITENNVVQL